MNVHRGMRVAGCSIKRGVGVKDGMYFLGVNVMIMYYNKINGMLMKFPNN
jgi:hypothetical protein